MAMVPGSIFGRSRRRLLVGDSRPVDDEEDSMPYIDKGKKNKIKENMMKIVRVFPV
jgi:hypothetical protein